MPEKSRFPLLPPLAAIVELLAITGLIAFADWAIPGLDVSSLEPNPYWLPVLLLSLQYGTVAGLLAAAMAVAIYLSQGMSDQGVGENLFAYMLRIWALPMLWIGVALVLGQIRLRQIELKRELRARLAQSTHDAETLAAYAAKLEARCLSLERTAAAGDASANIAAIGKLNEIAASGRGIDAVLQLVGQRILPGAALSLYRLGPDRFERIADYPIGHAAARVESFPASHSLYQALAVDERAVSILNSADEMVLSDLGLAASPIRSVEGDRVIGAITIGDAGPALLTPNLADALAAIGAMIAPLIDPETARTRGHAEAAGPLTANKRGVVALLPGARRMPWRRIGRGVEQPATAERVGRPARTP